MARKWIMKYRLLVAVSAAGIGLTLASCADQSAAVSSADPANRTYTGNDLNNTGRHDTASAIQAADPSVRISGGR
jgi:hypothetical protein